MKAIGAGTALALLLSGVGTASIAQTLDAAGCDRTQDIIGPGYINNPTCGETYGSDDNTFLPPPPLIPPPAPVGDGGDSGNGASGGGDSGNGASGGGDSGNGNDSITSQENLIAASLDPDDLPFLLGDNDFSRIG